MITRVNHTYEIVINTTATMFDFEARFRIARLQCHEAFVRVRIVVRGTDRIDFARVTFKKFARLFGFKCR